MGLRASVVEENNMGCLDFRIWYFPRDFCCVSMIEILFNFNIFQ